MKATASILLLAASLLSSGAEPDSKVLGHCPYGHDTLKDIPILYDLGPFEDPDAKKERANLAPGEYVIGSDAFDADSPRIQVTCTTCGFEHTQSFFGSWARSSANAKSFQTPLTDLLTSFPSPPAKKLREPAVYWQAMDDKLHVFAEQLSYNSAESLDSLELKIDGWLKRRGIAFKKTTAHDKGGGRPYPYGAQDSIRWRSVLQRGEWFEINVSFGHKDKRCYVDVSHDWYP